MDTLGLLMQGFANALTPMNLLWALAGVTVGTAIGVLPGLGPGLTIALLLPITYKVDPTSAFILFAGIYYGAMYGGSTTSILINTPGESATIITAMEGHKMAKKGRAGAALATAAVGSFVAGTFGTLGITFLAQPVVELALKFGPAEYFSLMILCFVTVSAVLGSSAVRGLTALAIGLFFGMIGIDLQSGQPRFTFGILELLDGINVLIVAVGLFAVGETLHLATQKKVDEEVIDIKGPVGMTKEDWKRSWKPWLRGTAFGFPIGAMPAGGAEIPTFLSYYTEKKLSKNPEEFGHGAIEGVAGPEAANNASAAGVLVPMLTLGLPTSATAAIMLSAFQATASIRSAASCDAGAAGLDADRLALHRQRDAAGAEPAAGGPVGEDPEDPAAAALRWHSRLRDHRHLWHQPLGGGSHPALHRGLHGLHDAPLRLPDLAGDHRDDPRSHGRAGIPPRDDHLERRPDDLHPEAAVAGAADPRGGCRARARDLEAGAPSCAAGCLISAHPDRELLAPA